MEEQTEIATPDFRAAIVGREVSLVEWDPRLSSTNYLAGEGETARYVDLWYLGSHDDHDVLVTHDAPDGIDAEMRAALCKWAELVGHRRIWFSKDVVELAGPLPESRRASTSCQSCRRYVSAEGLGFWSNVRAYGTFPNRCAACGGVLPQWSIEEAQEGAGA